MMRIARHPIGARLLALLYVLSLSAGVFTLTACHAPVSIQTTAGQHAYAADQVVQRFTEFSNLVKADTGTQPGNIAPRDAFTIIEWVSGDAKATPPTTGVVQIVQTTAGQGWKAAALQSYQTRVRPLLLKYPKLAPWADILDGLLEVL